MFAESNVCGISLRKICYFKGTKFRGWVGTFLIFAGIEFRG